MKIALLQMRSGLDMAANARDLARGVEAAAAMGAELVATPEMTGYLDRDGRRMAATVRAPADDPTLTAGRDAARSHGLWVLIGSLAVKDSGASRIANRAFLIDPEGAVSATYDKAHLFDADVADGESYRESKSYGAGETLVTAEGPGCVLGLGVCFDLRFPEFYRAMARAGATVMTAPSAFTVPTGRAHWEVLLRARAIECAAFMLAPAQGGLHDDGRRTWGRSMIVDPWGTVIAAAEDDEPGLVLADLDMGAVAAARKRIPAWAVASPLAQP